MEQICRMWFLDRNGYRQKLAQESQAPRPKYLLVTCSKDKTIGFFDVNSQKLLTVCTVALHDKHWCKQITSMSEGRTSNMESDEGASFDISEKGIVLLGLYSSQDLCE
jgi:hypothetical protein